MSYYIHSETILSLLRTFFAKIIINNLVDSMDATRQADITSVLPLIVQVLLPFCYNFSMHSSTPRISIFVR